MILINQKPGDSTFVDASTPDAKYRLQAQRINTRIRGFAANTMRSDVLLATPVSLDLGCDDNCVAPSIQPRITRVSFSGGVGQKAAFLQDLKYLVQQVESGELDSVFEGFVPTNLAPVYPFVVGA